MWHPPQLNERSALSLAVFDDISGPVYKRIRPAWVVAWVFLLLFATTQQQSFASQSGSQKSNSPSRESLIQLQAECSHALAQLKTTIDNLKEKSQLNTLELLREELELWERYELVVAQRLSTLDDREEVNRQFQLIHEPQTEEEHSGKPYSFLKLDELRNSLLGVRDDAAMLELERQAEQALLIDAKQQLSEVESKRRMKLEAVATGPSETTPQQHEVSLLNLRCRVYGCMTSLHRERADILELQVELTNSQIQALESRVKMIAQNVRFSSEELDERLGMISNIQEAAEKQLKEAEGRMRRLAQRHSQDGSSLPEDIEFQTARDESELLQQLLTEISAVRDCWRHRYQFANKDFQVSEPDQWLDDAIASKRRIDRLAEKLNLHRMHWQNTAMSLQRKANLGEVEGEQLALLSNQILDIEKAIDFYSSTQVLTAGGQRLYERFIDELEDHLDKITWKEATHRFAVWLDTIWNFEITSIDDRPITISKICRGLILLLVGYWFARFLSGAIAKRVMPRFGLSPTAIAPLRTVLFYSLLIITAFVSLEVVNVPLTVFTFLGGAIAIGVGFGSQNILNNFISGLILLVERPIRIGDLVNIEGIDANVEHIGARSTRVRTGANLEILVPNSKFLENNVTNWTLSDTRSRTSITVGVAYGSPVRKIIEVLDSTIRNHSKVITEPAPIVLFKNFGDSALEFEVHFWIHMQRMMEAARVQSDIRVAIDDRFREEGIVIAFPQTDVHLDLQKPIEVRLNDQTQSAPKAFFPRKAA
ncbi:mechanosensitive ion channel domain-containing protein [Bythopirellula polymerisocia]|uniref:Mechanosensitive channel MscK n=1 Tax=Bythopirellula polymerisocia TaxID=2528003 RepID=A0A5C6CWS9_9BACT|nr:mechanosensitive ion channel domain-containing protein [Bythopirellula polymerisocia]TWU27466.1 Mechanosensitive channel MscK precursor [Bythopirellula polymerisocia]